MTREEINSIADMFISLGKRIPVCPHEWREMQMTSKTIGKVSQKELAKGKIKPQGKARHFAKRDAEKASRVIRRLKANRGKE